MAEAVGWMDAKGGYCCLQKHGTCEDRRGPKPTALLIEDGPMSDTRGWPRNGGGAPLACLCRYHDLEYHNLRLSLKCTEPGCWHLGEPGFGGKRLCPRHANPAPQTTREGEGKAEGDKGAGFPRRA